MEARLNDKKGKLAEKGQLGKEGELGKDAHLGKKGQLNNLREYIEHHKNIHRIIKKHSPKAHRSARKLFNFRFPKLLIFVICVIAAYLIFRNPVVYDWASKLGGESYLWIFFFGVLFSFGFTTPFAVGFFVSAQPDSIFLAMIIGGFGALLADMLIFKLIRFSFMDEFELLNKTSAIQEIEHIVKKNLGVRIVHYLIFAIAGLVLASPLPDELGVAMLAGMVSAKPKVIGLLSFVFNSLGILIMLLASAA